MRANISSCIALIFDRAGFKRFGFALLRNDFRCCFCTFIPQCSMLYSRPLTFEII